MINLFYFKSSYDCFLVHSGCILAKDGNQYCYFVVWRPDDRKLFLFVERPFTSDLRRVYICSCFNPAKYYLYHSIYNHILFSKFKAVSILW